MSPPEPSALQQMYADRPEGLAQMLYKAFHEHGAHPWQTWDGRVVPAWEDLPQATREQWTAAAQAALRVR